MPVACSPRSLFPLHGAPRGAPDIAVSDRRRDVEPHHGASSDTLRPAHLRLLGVLSGLIGPDRRHFAGYAPLRFWKSAGTIGRSRAPQSRR